MGAAETVPSRKNSGTGTRDHEKTLQIGHVLPFFGCVVLKDETTVRQLPEQVVITEPG